MLRIYRFYYFCKIYYIKSNQTFIKIITKREALMNSRIIQEKSTLTDRLLFYFCVNSARKKTYFFYYRIIYQDLAMILYFLDSGSVVFYAWNFKFFQNLPFRVQVDVALVRRWPWRSRKVKNVKFGFKGFFELFDFCERQR